MGAAPVNIRIPQQLQSYVAEALTYKKALWLIGGFALGYSLPVITGEASRTPEEVAVIDAEAIKEKAKLDLELAALEKEEARLKSEILKVKGDQP